MLHILWEVHFYVIFGNVIILFIVYQILWIRFKYSKLQWQKNRYTDSPYSYNNSNQSVNKSPADND